MLDQFITIICHTYVKFLAKNSITEILLKIQIFFVEN
jgi:hypothetical protein